MANPHCWLHAYGKKERGGGSLVAYLKREGAFAPVRYLHRQGTQYETYTDFTEGGVRNMPAWAHGDAETFFTTAMQQEGQNRYYAFQVQFSLPRELDYDRQMALKDDVIAATMPDLPGLWVRHDKQLENGDMHPHIHLLLSARKQDGIDRGPAQMFTRWNRQHPERGGCEKDLWWSRHSAPEALRHAVADLTNYHLEQVGETVRVDFRSTTRRNLHRDASRRTHPVTLDEATRQREARQAQDAWEYRKVYRGYTDVGLSREAMVALVRMSLQDYQPGRRHTSQVDIRLLTEQRLQGIQHRLHQLQRAQRGELRAHELLAVLQGEDRVQHGLTAHLDQREDWGYGYGR